MMYKTAEKAAQESEAKLNKLSPALMSGSNTSTYSGKQISLSGKKNTIGIGSSSINGATGPLASPSVFST